MLYRNKKPHDPNAGKWIGIGGRIEPGETPDACNRREAFRADTGTSANCRITIIAAEGVKPGAHSGVAQNTLSIDDLLD